MRSIKYRGFWIAAFTIVAALSMGSRCPFGLNPEARQELIDAGLATYIGEFTPVSSEDVGDGWTKHTFDTDGGDGPICIAGTPFSVFTRAGDPKRLLIFEQGGGACWQDFYVCNIQAEAQEPPTARAGIWDFDNPDNPFADYSIVYMPYCDGSVFSGDNDVVDESFPFGPVRFHRGLRNQTAAMDVGREVFPDARKITVAGSSAGGVGVAGNAPFLVRLLWGNLVDLTVFNDAGPVHVNLDPSQAGAIAARAADWDFGKFYPASCTECDDMGKATPVIDWRLDNDRTIREAFYSTDGDQTNRFFLGVPTQEQYRELVVTQHDELHDAHPFRYKRFIVSGDDSHTALQNVVDGVQLFYTQDANGTVLNEWADDFLNNPFHWRDEVEDFVPVP